MGGQLGVEQDHQQRTRYKAYPQDGEFVSWFN